MMSNPFLDDDWGTTGDSSEPVAIVSDDTTGCKSTNPFEFFAGESNVKPKYELDLSSLITIESTESTNAHSTIATLENIETEQHLADELNSDIITVEEGSSKKSEEITLSNEVDEMKNEKTNENQSNQAIFDDFDAKFDSVSMTSGAFTDPFAIPSEIDTHLSEINKSTKSNEMTFDIFDPFANSIQVPKNTPMKKSRHKQENDDTENFDPLASPKQPATPRRRSSSSSSDDDQLRVVIKTRNRPAKAVIGDGSAILLPPPPKVIKETRKNDASRVENFDEFDLIFGDKKKPTIAANQSIQVAPEKAPKSEEKTIISEMTHRDDEDDQPLFDDDISQPLKEFPVKYTGNGWSMYMRHPVKKKFTSNRFWKKLFVKLKENNVLQLFNDSTDAQPFQELPLQACYTLSDISQQQYDQYGKIFTVKLQYIFYRERIGVRRGQLAKVMQPTQSTSISSIRNLTMPLEHSPQASEIIKLATHAYDDLRQFVDCIENAFFHMSLHRDRCLQYKTEEIQLTIQDEVYVNYNRNGFINEQSARVRIFMLAFVNGMPLVEIGVNDIKRQGKEVVGRHDIIPMITEEWIRLEACEFHSSVMADEYEKSDLRLIKLHPPDACFFELMRFRVRPPKNREVPLQLICDLYVMKNQIELRCEILVAGCMSRKYGQICCEDVTIRIPIPECWVYFFRNEKHLRYGSVKSANRRPGKIKGFDRFLVAAGNMSDDPTMLEASAGQAKYEHPHQSLVWRIPRLPKDGQNSYNQQLMVFKLCLTSFDQIPEKFDDTVDIEFTMPATTVSHAMIRSVSVANGTGEDPPEKFVRNVSRHHYQTQMVIKHQREIDSYTSAIAKSAQISQSPHKSSNDVRKENKQDVDDEDDDDNSQ